MPKQAELDKYMEKLKKKIINNYELPLTTKELIPEQKRSPFFKDIYKYVTSGRIPSNVTGKAAHILQRECENYLIAEGVLFRIRIPSEPNEEPELLLCIPENNTQYLLYHYQDTLLAAHQGVTRMYLTIREKFFVPRLFDNIQRYVQSCDICQKTCNMEKGPEAYHVRVPFDFRPMTRLSCDIKHMPVSSKGYKYILFVTCEVSNYTIAIPLFREDSLSIAEAILNKVVYQFGPPSMIIIDEGKAMSSEVMTYIYEALRIKPIVTSPENHGSLRTE